MRISYNWLKDYVDIKVSGEALAELLTMAGLTVDSVRREGDDYILETEVTANRPDWLSYIGVAREVAALTGKRLKSPAAHITASKVGSKTVNIRVENKTLCPRYTARIIRDVKISESPAQLKSRLESADLRPVNNVVDVTNFCLFETGEPMHAFDLDRLDGGEIIVRQARKGEKITTIDGIERPLDESVLVIADRSRPVAIAGVMGGLNTEVTAATKNILLEAAFFDPISVRRTARKLGISTESSYRFERKTDIANIENYSDRASQLILETAGGRTGEFIDIGLKAGPKKKVALKYDKVNAVLGIGINPAAIKKILNSLGLKTDASSKSGARFEIPSFRYDLNSEIDLIEEISRIYGYDKVPSTIPEVLEQPVRRPHEMVVSQAIRENLASSGYSEIITYSLISKDMPHTDMPPGNNIAEIRNPLTSDQDVMRPSLMAGALSAVLWNINRKTKDLKLFELGNVYSAAGDDKFNERKSLSMAVAGSAYSNWADGTRQAGLFDLKGALETLFSALVPSKVSFTPAKENGFVAAACASIEIEAERVGIIGELSPKVLNNFGIKEKVYFCEICIDSVSKHIDLARRFNEPPKYPSVSRDISIVVGKDVAHAELVGTIASSAGTILKEIALVDRYTGKQIPDGKIGLTYRLEYQDSKKTLEDKDISGLHAGILRALEEKFGAKLR